MRRLLLATGILFAVLSSQAGAQAWPTKTINVVVPLTAGSATDVMARIVFDQVSQQVGQSIVIENRPGAGNSIGMNAVAKADPDGYTILANSSSHTVSPAVRATMPLDTPNDLAAIIPPPLYRNPTVARKVNVDATKALVRAAEAQPDPPRFIQASSNAVYGSRNPHRVTDVVRADTPPHPFELYSNTKFEAEQFVRNSNLEWVVLRLVV